MSYFKKQYNEKIIHDLSSQLERPLFSTPKIKKICINMGLGSQASSSEYEAAASDLSLIAGQKAVITKAKKSIAAFKIREEMSMGCKVTLRGDRMYEFLDRLIMVALPRVRDFRGLSAKSFDGNGNYVFGLKEQIVFPEIDYDKVDNIRGMDINIVTSTSSNEEAMLLLKQFKFPFANSN